MTSAVNSFLRHLAQTPCRFVNVKSYSTTSKRVSALVYLEHKTSGNSKNTKSTVVYLPSSQLLISKTGRKSPQFEATRVDWGNHKHFLSGLPSNVDYDEEGTTIRTQLKKAVVIPAEQEESINKLARKIHILEIMRKIIQTNIDKASAEIDDECEKLGDLFK